MKVRLDIPNKIYRALVKRARKDGIAVNELVVRFVEWTLARESIKKVNLPIIESKRPGSLRLDNAKIFEIIDFP